MIPDPIQIKRVERILKRSLTEEERLGLKAVRFTENGERKIERIKLISLFWLHNNNSCQ